jgi:uncharacterized protein YxjI
MSHKNGPSRYKMRQRLTSLTDDFTIENERGERVFYVDGKLLRLRDTLVFKDMDGNEVCKIQEKLLSIRDTLSIYSSGRVAASVRRDLVQGLRDRWAVKVVDGPDLKVKGELLDHEYSISQGCREVARISRRWFSLRDSYGVEIQPGQDDVLILAISVAIDMMAHQGK